MSERRQVDVVTVYSPHPEHEKWYDYLPLLRAQRDSAAKFGHQHWVVTDANLGDEFLCLREPLPSSLMKAMIAGVIARLVRGGNRDLVFVDADCLINRDLAEAFDHPDRWDLILTRRENEISPINNGAMYVRCEGIASCWRFFGEALARCGDHWGADQQAISQAAAPVPNTKAFGTRHGCRIMFADMKPYNVVPKEMGRKHGSANPFVVHFKGTTKDWMEEYAARFITV